MVSAPKWALGQLVGQRWLVVRNGQLGAELRKEVATPAAHLSDVTANVGQ